MFGAKDAPGGCLKLNPARSVYGDSRKEALLPRGDLLRTLLVALVFGSSLLAQGQSPNPRAACGPANVSFSVKLHDENVQPALPEPGKALVYFIQDSGGNAGLGYPTTRLGLDGAWVGANKDSSYFAVPVEPGEHHVCAMVQSSLMESRVELAHLDAEAGKVYYFRTRLLLARGLEYLELAPVDGDEGWNLVNSFPLSTWQPKK